MEDIRVIRQTTEQTFSDTGQPVEQIRVEFKVGEDGPFYKRFPASTFDGYQVKTALESFAQHLRTVKGS